MNQNPEEMFAAAELSLNDGQIDAFLQKDLGPHENYSFVGTPMALLLLSKKLYQAAIEKKLISSEKSFCSIGSLNLNISTADTAAIVALRGSTALKKRRLGLASFILVPFWLLAGYGAYAVFLKLLA